MELVKPWLIVVPKIVNNAEDSYSDDPEPHFVVESGETNNTNEPGHLFLDSGDCRNQEVNHNFEQIVLENGDIGVPEVDCNHQKLVLENGGNINKSKKRKRYDRQNFCIFCKKLVKKLSRHLVNNHKKEHVISQYIKLLKQCPEESKEKRKTIIADLTLRGNKEYNKTCLKNALLTSSKPKILPVRRPSLKNQEKKHTYVSCLICHGFYVKRHFHKHSAVCAKKEKARNTDYLVGDNVNLRVEDEHLRVSEKRRISYLKTYGVDMQAVLPVNTSKQFKDLILSTLRMDDIGKKAIQDSLLVSIVADYYNSHQAVKDKSRITKKLRDGAKLLNTVQELDESINEFKDIFKPSKVETIVDACQMLCNLDDMEAAIQNPDLVTFGMNQRLLWLLDEGGKKLLYNISCDDNLTDGQKKQKKIAFIAFHNKLRRRWKFDISTNLENIRSEKMKPFILPDDEDIKKFTIMLKDMELEYQRKLTSIPTIENYEMLCKVTICHILILNRRPYEATNYEIDFYLKRKKNEDNYTKEVLESLGQEEQLSLNELSSYIVPLKGNEEVATVLLTKNMESSIDKVISYRKHFDVDESIYLFPRPFLDTLFDVSKVMRELVSLCPGLQKPEFLTANGLCHNITTKNHFKVQNKNFVTQASAVNKGIVGNYLNNEKGKTREQHENCMSCNKLTVSPEVQHSLEDNQDNSLTPTYTTSDKGEDSLRRENCVSCNKLTVSPEVQPSLEDNQDNSLNPTYTTSDKGEDSLRRENCPSCNELTVSPELQPSLEDDQGNSLNQTYTTSDKGEDSLRRENCVSCNELTLPPKLQPSLGDDQDNSLNPTYTTSDKGEDSLRRENCVSCNELTLPPKLQPSLGDDQDNSLNPTYTTSDKGEDSLRRENCVTCNELTVPPELQPSLEDDQCNSLNPTYTNSDKGEDSMRRENGVSCNELTFSPELQPSLEDDQDNSLNPTYTSSDKVEDSLRRENGVSCNELTVSPELQPSLEDDQDNSLNPMYTTSDKGEDSLRRENCVSCNELTVSPELQPSLEDDKGNSLNPTYTPSDKGEVSLWKECRVICHKLTVPPELQPSLEDDQDNLVDPTYTPSDSLSSYSTMPKRTVMTKKTKQKWSYDEKKLVSTYFSRFLRTSKSPGTNKCRQFVEEFGDKLSNRNAIQVYTFIHNIITKKTMLPKDLLDVNDISDTV